MRWSSEGDNTRWGGKEEEEMSREKVAVGNEKLARAWVVGNWSVNEICCLAKSVYDGE